MAEDQETNYNGKALSRNEQIIMAAFSSINFEKCKTFDELQKTLLVRTETLNNFLYPNSLQMRVMDSIRIKARIKSIKYEESSTRYIITYVPDVIKDGCPEEESVRSDYTDGDKNGKIAKMWENLENKHVIIYMRREKTGNKNKPIARVAPYVKLCYEK